MSGGGQCVWCMFVFKYLSILGGPAAPLPPPVKTGGAPPPPPPSRGDKPNPNLPTVTDERGDLLASIRKGKQLKKVAVDESSHNVSPPPDSGGGLSITDALLRALHQRQTAIQSVWVWCVGVVCGWEGVYISGCGVGMYGEED